MNILKIFLVIILVALLSSCDSFEYHPYAKKIEGEKHILDGQIDKIQAICQNMDTICFAFLTDTQGGYDELNEAVKFINKIDRIQFVIHGGDQTDFGLIKEFEWCRNSLSKLNKPYCVVIGNHDCIGTGEHSFKTIYGDTNYSFNANFVHILCINTVALEYDYSEPVPDFTFLEKDCKGVMDINASNDSIIHTIVVMHAPPYGDQFNNNVAEPFEYYIKKFPGARDVDDRYSLEPDSIKNGTMKHANCLFGHIHSAQIVDYFNDGLLYYSCTNIKNKQILVFTITRDGYECEKIIF